MRKFKEVWRIGALLTVALLFTLAVACGDDDDDDDGGSATAGATSPAGGSPSGTSAGELQTDFGVSDTEITIGQTNDLAGTGGTPYSVITPAMQAYFAKVNSEGGVCDRQINLIAEDDAYSPPQTTEKTKKLVEQDEILAMVGALGTGTHLAVVDYLNDPNGDGNQDDGVPDLFVSTGYSGWGDADKWPWTTGFIPDYNSDATIQATILQADFPDAKVGVIYQNDAFGQDYLAALQDALGDMIVSEQPHEAANTDVTSQVLTLQSEGADVVFLATTPRATASAITAARTHDYEPQFFESYVNSVTSLGSLIGGGTNPDQVAAGYAEIEGNISTNYILDPIADAATDAMVEHKAIMEGNNGPAVSSLSVYGQALAETAVHTLEIACENGDMTRAGVLAAAESITDFHPSLLLDGVNVTIGPGDHYAIQALLPVKINADGSLEPLADEPIESE